MGVVSLHWDGPSTTESCLGYGVHTVRDAESFVWTVIRGIRGLP